MLAMLWLAGCRTLKPPPDPGRAVDATGAVQEWLDTNCALEEETRLSADLLKFAPGVETQLLDAFKNGPPSARVAVAVKAANDRYDALEVYRTKQKRSAEPPTRAEFVAQAKARFDRGYRTTALAGLGQIGGTAGIRLLQELAAAKSSPYSEIANDILEENARR
jgi:hypothetical protein